MAVAPRLAAQVLAVLTSHACTPVCDEVGLRRAAAAIAGSERQAGLDAIRDACPTIPPALLQGLATGESATDGPQDPAWLGLLARTCPGATHARGAAAVHEELDGARQLCDVDRHGLLAADAVFARDDLFVFALYEWLLGGRVDRPLAMAVAQPLLTAEEFAAVGVTPPHGRTDAPLRRFGVEIRVTPTALAVDGVVVLPLERGRPPPRAVRDHEIRQLRTALEIPAGRAKQRTEATGRPWDSAATLLVDRTVPFSTLADVMFTGLVADYVDFQLVVHDGRELRGQSIQWARGWAPHPLEESYHRGADLDLTFVVGVDAVVAHLGAGPGEGRRIALPAGAEIAELVAKLKRLFPNEVVATFRVDAEVPVQALVSLMDTVAGEGCHISSAIRGERVPDECLFWQPILDHEPPFRGWPRPP